VLVDFETERIRGKYVSIHNRDKKSSFLSMSQVLNRNQIVKITATIVYTSVIEIYIKKNSII